MRLADFASGIENLSDDALVSTFDVCLNPPVRRISSGEVLTRSRGLGLPPQPSEEILDTKVLIKKVKVEDAVKAFLAVDQVKSLLPNNVLTKTIQEGPEGRAGTIRRWVEKLRPSFDTLDRLKTSELIPEDASKEKILLVVPSRRQFDSVRGRHREWVWKKKNYMGDKSPSEDGWLQSISNLCHALNENAVSTTIAADANVADKVRASLPSSEIVEIDIPEHLPKIGYPRDPSVTWFKRPIIGNMALGIRKGEEEIFNEVYSRLGCLPAARLTWALVDDLLVKAKMEGGNFFLLRANGQTALLTGIGIRGSNLATFKAIDEIMPKSIRLIGIPLPGYIKEWECGAVHLDVALAYLGDINGQRWALVDPSRIGFYSVLEYDRERQRFRLSELTQLAKEFEITLEEPPRKGGSKITMTNSLNLGKGKYVVDSMNKDVNRFLQKELGAEVIEVNIADLEAGGGGPRCATRELFT